jgi:hypothetical protein
MDPACKKFVKAWLLATVGALVVVAGLNILVDPLGAYPGLHLKSFEPLRYMNEERTAKAEMARRGDWEALILGSSRAETGIPATHPFVTTQSCCNLSFPAARFPELVRAFEYASERNPLKRVVLCLDLYMFNQGPPWVLDFPDSRFNPSLELFPYRFKQLLGSASTGFTWTTLWRKVVRSQPLPQQTRGFHYNRIRPGVSQRELFNHLLPIIGAGYGPQMLDWSYVEQLRQVVRDCRERKIDLRIAIMPVHALDLEYLHARGGWPQFEEWKKKLVGILAEEGVEDEVALWDFTAYAGPPAEAVPPAGDVITRMKYYFENSHFTPVLGALMLDAMFGAPGANEFGVKINRVNIEAHLAHLRKDRTAYIQTNAADVQWVQRLARAGGANPK